MATKSSRPKSSSKSRSSAKAKTKTSKSPGSTAHKKKIVAKATKGKEANRNPSKKKFAKAKSGFKSKKKIATAVKKVAVKAPGKETVKSLAKPVAPESPLLQVVRRGLDDMKAVNVKVIDVTGKSDVADTMVIASGNSDRHVKSIADRVVEFAKQTGFRPMGVEGGRDGEWVLVDLQDVIVHVMLPRVREFYRLEDLWDIAAASRNDSKNSEG
jgi:ribosome-associated protein